MGVGEQGRREKEFFYYLCVACHLYSSLEFRLGHWNFSHIFVLFQFWIGPLQHKRETSKIKSN